MQRRPGVRSAAFVAIAVSVVAPVLAACSSRTPIVREVPLVREVLPDPPFPEGWRIVDLTMPLDAAVPRVAHARQFPFERIELEPESPDGVRTGAFTAMEHMGTHLAAPRTRAGAGSSVDAFGASDLLLPLVVLDLPPNLGPTGVYPVEELVADERERGLFPPGAVVVLRTRRAGPPHPGFSPAAIELLAQRRVRVVGTDATGVDPSTSAGAPAQAAGARAGVWFLSNLRRVDDLPSRGAFVVVGVLPVVGAAGAPARVVALVRQDADVQPPPGRDARP